MQSRTFAYRLLPLHKLFLLQYAAQRQLHCDVAGKCQSRGRAEDDRDGRRGLGGSRGLDAGVQFADPSVAVVADEGRQAICSDHHAEVSGLAVGIGEDQVAVGVDFR